MAFLPSPCSSCVGTCDCVILSTPTVTVTGVGTAADPYLLTAVGGGGGGGNANCVTTTIAGVTALQTAGTLDTCTLYIVTDWTTPNALPGPNFLFVRASAANKINPEVGVYATVNATDPVLQTYVGPVRGTYFWEGPFSGMRELESAVGNKVSDLIGGAVIDAIPWNTFVIRNSTITDVTFTGGYATMSALFTSLGTSQISNCQLNGGTMNFTGITGLVSLVSTSIRLPAFVLVGPNATFNDCKFGTGTGIDLTGKTAGSFTMTRCDVREDRLTSGLASITCPGDGVVALTNLEMIGSSIGINSDANMEWDNSVLTHTTAIVGAGSRGLNVNQCDLTDSTIFQLRTGGAGVTRDTLFGSDMTAASFSLNGATDPGINQSFQGITISTGSITVTNPAAVAFPVEAVTVQAAGILQVAAGGQIFASRVACEATVNTAAFALDHVIVEGLFTKTATAANSNRLTNKSFDDFV